MAGIAVKSIGRSVTTVRPQALVERLEEIRAAGLVHRASEQTGDDVEQVLPLVAELRPLFPGGALRRGSAIAISGSAVNGGGDRAGRAGQSVGGGAAGAVSLLIGVLAEASAAGSWCGVVGLPDLGWSAAAEAGMAVQRCALVPYPGPDWAPVVAALLDGVDIVVTANAGQISAQVASRLTARARQRGAVLVCLGQWPGADLTLEVVDSVWHGLGQGRGRLRQRELSVRAHGRGAASRPRKARLWWPAPLSAPAPRPVVSDLPIERPVREVA